MKEVRGLKLRALYVNNDNNNSNANSNNNLNNNAQLLRISQTAPGQPSLWETLCSYENLELAFLKARKRKTLKHYVIDFENNLKENLLQLRSELLMYVYRPASLETFIIRDPKTRKISKSSFRDRVIHHAIINVIEPLIDKHFIFDSYANRISKGTLNAVKRFNKFKQKVSRNNTRNCFVFKADIKRYFDSVNHEILITTLQKYIYDENIINLIRLILNNHKTSIEGQGMPLGNLTSQFFANVYLNELDQFVKHELKAKYYIRYVDDFVILHNNPAILNKHQIVINNFLQFELKLKLHPQKSRIINLKKGISFLGFRIFENHQLLHKKNLRRFKNKLLNQGERYKKKQIDRDGVVEQFQGWIAYAKNANTYKLRKLTTKKFNHLFLTTNKNEDIVNIKKHENLQQEIYTSKLEFSSQKTKQLFEKGLSVKEIAIKRELKESTIHKHLLTLLEHHQIKLKELLPSWKIKIILKHFSSLNDSLKTIRQQINKSSISYNDIDFVRSVIKAKQNKKNITYHVELYQKTVCKKKCNVEKIVICRLKFQQLLAHQPNLAFTRKEFNLFMKNGLNFCNLE